MRYSRVYLDAIGYELAPVVVTSEELEDRLRPLYERVHIPRGQLQALTGIAERRWWEQGYPLSGGATAAALKALAAGGVPASEVEAVIYAGVCRENFEPATACRVANALGVSPGAAIYDVSNACLGVLNGIVDIANRIELGQLRAGLVVSCESAREIVELSIERLLRNPTMERYKASLATLTGGSGAVAVLLTDGSFSNRRRRRLVGGASRSAPEHHSLCRWGIDPFHWEGSAELIHHVVQDSATVQAFIHDQPLIQSMVTDSVSVLRFGVDLGRRTWQVFLERVNWAEDRVDKVICHQVGGCHRDAILKALGLPLGKDFSTYAYLGNMGTVSLPMTAALAEERDFLRPGDRVGFLGIGSGLNCLMLGWEW